MAAKVTTDQPPTSVLDELMTAGEVATILQLRVSTVEDYARRGVLPSIKVGRHRRFLRSEVDSAIARLAGR
jgi:excisionase family DNA binding protein